MSLMNWIETQFNRLFRRVALPRYGLRGVGTVTTPQGHVTSFWIRGDATDAALRMATARVARTLYGPLAGGPLKRMLGAVTHPTAVRNSLANLVVDLIDAGAAAGYLEIDTSGDVEVATLTFSDPAFGNASSGTATANAITSDTNATGGTAAKAFAADSDDTPVFLCAVGTSGSDINLSSVAIGAGDTVSISSLTYSAAA